MNTSPSEQNQITVRSYRNNDRAILFSPAYFFRINDEHIEEEGKSLIDLAESDPAEAYRFIRLAVGAFAVHNTSKVTEDHFLLADNEHDGKEATAELAESTVMKYLPAPYEGPFNVAIRLLPTEADRAMGLDEPATLLELHVEPPDYA